jgi:pimeloyl-ACP methyl ester carboxylesterase
MDRIMLETGLVAPGNDPRPCRTGWWSNALALMKVWSQRPIDHRLASGGRPMLVLYGAQDGITPVPNVLSLRDELGDQVRLIEIADAATACHRTPK